MPWPKGRRIPPEMLARQADSRAAAAAARRRRPIVISGVEHWRCTACDEALTADRFHATKTNTSGLTSRCRRCHSRQSIATRDPVNHREKKRLHEATRRARARRAMGTVTTADLRRLADILGTDCLLCRFGESMQWDHIVPIARGGAHHPTNLQPLCRRCNERKQARHVDHRSPEQIAAVSAVWVIGFRRTDV